jgi:hypothetical protein
MIDIVLNAKLMQLCMYTLLGERKFVVTTTRRERFSDKMINGKQNASGRGSLV